jgi:acyl carrier protein
MREPYASLSAIIGKELGVTVPELDAESQLDDLPGWDSVALAGVLVALEARFGVAVGRTEIDAIETAGDLARLCAAATR